MQLGEIMTTSPEYLTPAASIRDAAEMMKGMDVGAVPVVQDDKVIGIVTDRDIVVRGIAGGVSPQAKLSQIMTHNIRSLGASEDVDRAFDVMEKSQIRRLPIVDESGSLIGIVSLGDLATRVEDRKKAGETLQGISEG